MDPTAGPVQQFAADLRAVREKAGNPKYTTMERTSGRSKTALTEAAGGYRLASWETVESYLTACGQDPAAWLDRWEQVREHVEQMRAPKASARPAAAQPPIEAAAPSRVGGPRRRLLLLGAGLVALAAAAALGGAALAGGSGPPAGSTGGAVTVVVQNKVASGPDGFYEDATPVYLSTKTEPMCSRNGCDT